MKISLSLLAAITMNATTTFIAVTASSSNIRLRGNVPSSTQENLNKNLVLLDFLNNHDAHDRDLQADLICNHIENAFDGDIACECNIQWTSMQVDFQCALLEQACISDTVAGTLCGKPQYTGKLTLDPKDAAAKWENDVCVDISYKTDSSPEGADIVSGNLCIEADLCFQWGQEGGGFSICGCAATFQDTPCQCTTCTLDDGGTGITLECLGAHTPVCLPLSFPEPASAANSVKPFIPILTVHHQ